MYPYPLQVYPNLLDTTLEGRNSLVHGDLHWRNVLVDESGKGWLIDFAKVQVRHNLFDFIKLETYIRLMVMAAEYGAFSWSEYVQFEQALNETSMDRKPASPTNASLAKAYEVIGTIRKIARPYMKDPRDFRKEYLPALFLYCLAMLKYHQSNGPAPTQLVFMTVCVAGQYLVGSEVPTDTAFQPPSGSSPSAAPTDLQRPEGAAATGATTHSPADLAEKSKYVTIIEHAKNFAIGDNAHVGQDEKPEPPS